MQNSQKDRVRRSRELFYLVGTDPTAQRSRLRVKLHALSGRHIARMQIWVS
ncbi:hypothetical protein FOQG_14935 [Fusarium oxysporum f. sp. raphani 54005]|uniref:Uncharacterized protein n=2 Tax=Fusarium oxysporum TaxID=5507 RepID=X0BNV1_FUSOX|nr:hypothetical protein FOVG_04008 [Fusarium oxysporum f. sp. pisi HDV247]EXK80583.1 hypothetical protein FOQG_14935 [Fusarium oxysporum f. sp. raphani 54005]